MATVAFIMPPELRKRVEEEAELQGKTMSRLVATIIMEYYDLDLNLPGPGRDFTTEKRKATKEIERATGQRPIRGANVGW